MRERKYKQNVTFLTQEYMGENTYTSVGQMVNPIRGSNQVDKYRALFKKIIQLEPNDWLKFQEKLKNLHLSKIYQTEAQTKQKKNGNKQREIQ